MKVSSRARRALASICDTFVPALDGLPSATDIGVPDAILDVVSSNPRAAERVQVAALLALWDARLVTALGRGGFRRFGSLSQPERERVLRSWRDSRLAQRRAAFQALRKGALVFYHSLPGPSGRNPVWEAIGYPGPLGAPASPPPRPVTPFEVSSDVELDCDVCVVGSGAGGAAAAAVLAGAGLDVIVLEMGGYYDEADFDGSEHSGISRMYLLGGAMATYDQGVGLLAGACLGGGTVVNYTTSFRTPEEVRGEWAAHGVPLFGSEEFTRSLDAVWERLSVSESQSRPSVREQVLRRGFEALGWHVGTMPRNVVGCDQGVICGYCPYGCQLGAKQSTVKTWLADAHAAEARILVRTRAERVVVAAGRAQGVESTTANGHRVHVRARAVVAAAGALGTPALLRRSGLANDNIGRHLRLHPVGAVGGIFEEEVRPWEGTMQAIYSDQHRDLQGGYGVKYESTSLHPGFVAGFAPWSGARQSRELMADLRHLVGAGVLLRDRDEGEVRVGRDGEPVVRYRLSDFDRNHMRIGVDGLAQVLEAAGARRIFSAHSQWITYEPGRRGRREEFIEQLDACGWGPGRYVLFSFHLMGTARMGGTEGRSACNPEGETWEVRDLYVADGSTFPTAVGVNPMVTIEAVGHLVGSRLAARLG